MCRFLGEWQKKFEHLVIVVYFPNHNINTIKVSLTKSIVTMRRALLTLLLFSISLSVLAQDSINVFFRYKARPNALRAFLPGAFYGASNPNNWGPNNNGQIAPNAISLMTYDSVNGFWFKTMRLQIGGGDGLLDGQPAYQYKMHEHYNASGSQWEWFTDPLNPNTFGSFNNSVVRVTHPMIFQIEPNNIGGRIITSASVPVIATVAARNDDPINPAQSRVFLNDTLVTTFGSFYDASRQLLKIPSLTALGANIRNGHACRFNEFPTTANTADCQSTCATGFERWYQLQQSDFCHACLACALQTLRLCHWRFQQLGIAPRILHEA
jgi:hypothetical protein